MSVLSLGWLGQCSVVRLSWDEREDTGEESVFVCVCACVRACACACACACVCTCVSLFVASYPAVMLCIASLSVGRWVSGDLHQPPGDCQDPPSGCRGDHHRATCERAQCGQGPSLLRPLQGGFALCVCVCVCVCVLWF